MQTGHPIDLLFPYVCGELSKDEAQRVSEHCAVCPACAREVDLTRATQRLLARRVPVTPPPFFWTRLSARLDAEGVRAALWPEVIWVSKRLIPALIAATLILTSLFWSDESAGNIENYLTRNGTEEAGEQVLVENQAISKETVFQTAVLDDAARSD